MTGPAAPLSAAFVLERHLGHDTFAANLRRQIERGPDADAVWIDVRYERSTAPWERLPLGGAVKGMLRGRSEVRRGLRDVRREVTFFNTQVPAVIGGRAARARPFVVCTDITPVQYDRMAAAYGHTPDTVGPTARLKHALNRRTFGGAAHVVGWSTWVRDSIVADYGVPPDRVSVIPPGVDTDRWTVRGPTHDGPLRVLFVGGDLYRKGGATLLRAFAALPPGSAELTLVTRSPDPGVPDVRVVHGMQPNSRALIDLVGSSDVLALPSEAEAFGIAAVEGSAAGLPVVATRVGGLTDIVADGETGYLITPGDAAELACRLRDLADRELRDRMGRAARARAVTRFDAARNARAIIDLLCAVAGGCPGAPTS